MLDKIYQLSRRLWPTGRAFRIPYASTVDKLMRAFTLTERQAVSDGLRTLDAILADNVGFSVEDATDWNIRLGMQVNESLNIEDRKSAILRKYNHPGNIPARQNYRYLERELRLAGFDVYVYENRFDDGMYGLETRSPGDVGWTGLEIQSGMIQSGEGQSGDTLINKVVESLTDAGDLGFVTGSLLRRTFFISGDPIATAANVDASREEEFRELILKIKPVQTIGFLNVNYT